MLIKENTITSEYTNIYNLQSYKIAIPIFQRFYDWKDKQIVQLKEDLLKAVENNDKQLYLLDFIYYEEDDYIKLADGQQRLVTLNNLIKAIKDVAKENDIQIDDIQPFDITYDVFKNQEKYEKHMNDYACAPFKKVYLLLKDFIKQNVDKINDFISIIKHNIYVFLKKCENADDAFEIFQQINTGGKPLTKDEVIKTALDQYSIAYQIRFETSKIKEVRQSIISFYKFKMTSFDAKFDNIEIMRFLKEYVTKDRNTFQKFVDTIQLLMTVDKCPIKYVINYINRATLLDVLNIFAMKNIDINRNVIYLRNVVIPLCMMSITLTLNGGSPTTFRYLLTEIVNDIKNDKSPNEINLKLIRKIDADPITWKISLDDFTKKLGDINTPRNLKKALLILDVIFNNMSGTLNVDTINLEHIYPQNPDIEWAQNGWPANHEDQKKLIDNIGNYLLLCEIVNKQIGNKYITNKVEKYRTIISQDRLLQTSINTIDFDKFTTDKKNYIYNRQTEIAKKLKDELPLGPVLITD